MVRLSSAIDIRDWQETVDCDFELPEDPKSTRLELLSAFERRLHIPSKLDSTLEGALRYVLEHPGSMVRARIVFRISTAYGYGRQPAMDLAIALEYFHTASLIFDDLPCMDNASMRRGAPCVHLPYGEAGAILAALALINRAYALVWRAALCSQRVERQAALAYLEEHLGVQGLLNGQSLDLDYHSLPHTPEFIERVARGKTVPLISLTLVMPAILGGASKRELQLLERISSCWGLAYQFVDDLKDVLESSSVTGKTSAQDAFLDRPNIALALGVVPAVNRLFRLLNVGDRTLETLIKLRGSLHFLREFRGSLKDELNRIIEGAGAIPIDTVQ
jgi:geranylgeranyl pyrophosphate synthase